MPSGFVVWKGHPMVELDGVAIEGLAGLRTYLKTKRFDTFVRQFNRKLLGYALGRQTQLSDQPLLDEIHRRMSQNDYRLSVAIEMIVLSPQFRQIRGRDARVADSPQGDVRAD